MSLKQIISISGKPGLFKILTGNKTPIVVQELASGAKRTLFPRDQVVGLSDISMYTNEGDKPLGEILQDVFDKYEGKELDAKTLTKSKDSLVSFFEEVVPTFDKDRVYPTDIKKVIQWYNLLIKDGFTSFVEEESKEPTKEE